MHSFIITYLTGILIVFHGCSGSAQLTAERLRDAVYNIPGVGQIRFTDGSYSPQGGHPTDTSFARLALVDLVAFGDLNGDGSDDAVTFVTRYGMNGEIFLSMEVFLNKSGTPVHTVSHLLGDRVAINHIGIINGLIDLRIITQGPGDAICCPTLHVSKSLRLRKGELREPGHTH